MVKSRELLYALLLFLLPAAAGAQIRTVPKEVLDSIANPPEADCSSLMEFDTKRIVTGEIGEDEVPVYCFSFVNKGGRPLEIRHITTSCGCAVAKCTAPVVNPGDSGKISVTYYPKGHPGKFERRIFVYTDLSDKRPTAVLSLSVNVRQGADRSYWFPHRMGSISMKVKEFTFRSDMKDVVCLDFLNSGDVPVTPGIAEEFLPDYIRAWCETPGVEPGKEGEICISFDPDRFAGSRAAGAGTGGPVRVPLILEGLGVSPGASTIMLYVD